MMALVAFAVGFLFAVNVFAVDVMRLERCLGQEILAQVAAGEIYASNVERMIPHYGGESEVIAVWEERKDACQRMYERANSGENSSDWYSRISERAIRAIEAGR
jgi:N-methylhydantoinase B/oxoprolinase/acetone carboxylase alpha subunit